MGIPHVTGGFDILKEEAEYRRSSDKMNSYITASDGSNFVQIYQTVHRAMILVG